MSGVACIGAPPRTRDTAFDSRCARGCEGELLSRDSSHSQLLADLLNPSDQATLAMPSLQQVCPGSAARLCCVLGSPCCRARQAATWFPEGVRQSARSPPQVF